MLQRVRGLRVRMGESLCEALCGILLCHLIVVNRFPIDADLTQLAKQCTKERTWALVTYEMGGFDHHRG